MRTNADGKVMATLAGVYWAGVRFSPIVVRTTALHTAAACFLATEGIYGDTNQRLKGMI